jgi:hypothetical protein
MIQNSEKTRTSSAVTATKLEKMERLPGMWIEERLQLPALLIQQQA